MDCGRVAREEVTENYLLGGLSEEDREAFEEHYFECARCFDELQTLHAIEGELRRAGAAVAAKTPRPFLRWVAATGLAAVLVLAVGVALWIRSSPPSDAPELTNVRPPSDVQLPEKPLAEGAVPTVPSEPSVEQLARVDPPRYEPLALRSVPDVATSRFQQGMERYRKADYAGAAADLRAAAELTPDAPHIRFFLGISHLLLGEDDAAVDQLQRTIALGDSAYLEEAHLYLAKAFLRRRDVAAAETYLIQLVQLGGSQSGQAKLLLSGIERLKQR
jgi:tetratricopeptide (TPR) repeat protein